MANGPAASFLPPASPLSILLPPSMTLDSARLGTPSQPTSPALQHRIPFPRHRTLPPPFLCSSPPLQHSFSPHLPITLRTLIQQPPRILSTPSPPLTTPLDPPSTPLASVASRPQTCTFLIPLLPRKRLLLTPTSPPTLTPTSAPLQLSPPNAWSEHPLATCPFGGTTSLSSPPFPNPLLQTSHI
jgi:hypothetical protein